VDADEEEEDEAAFDTSTMPPYGFRLNTVKLLLEVGDHARALRVVDTLVRSPHPPLALSTCGSHVVCPWTLGSVRRHRWPMTTRSCLCGTCADGHTPSLATATPPASRSSMPSRCAHMHLLTYIHIHAHTCTYMRVRD
jgi:hypothetical protein